MLHLTFSLSDEEYVKVFNPFPLKKPNEYVIWKEKKRIPNVVVWISWTNVCHPLFERFMRSLSGTRPFNMRYSSGELRFNHLGAVTNHRIALTDAERTEKNTKNVYPVVKVVLVAMKVVT